MSPSTSTSTSSRSFVSKLFFWSSGPSASSPPSDVDLEAQTIPSLPTVSVPAAAHTTSTARLPGPAVSDKDFDTEDDCTDAIDDFFGVTYTRQERRAKRLARLASQAQAQAMATATHASRHDAAVPTPIVIEEPSLKGEEPSGVPPRYSAAYADSDCATIVASLPTYAETVPKPAPEPFTIPQALFRYGFFCPLFWPLGACLLINFHSPSELVAFYTPEESTARVRALRAAEVKWARRCLLATVVLTFVTLMIVGMTYGIMLELKN